MKSDKPTAKLDDRHKTVVRFTPAQWKKVRKFVFDDDTTAQDLMIASVTAYLESRGIKL